MEANARRLKSGAEGPLADGALADGALADGALADGAAVGVALSAADGPDRLCHGDNARAERVARRG